MRVFIAVPCPAELREGMVEIQEMVGGVGRMSLVKSENIHLTMKFLGEVDESKVPGIVKGLESLSDYQKFEISLRGVGVFPNPSHIRVIWVGVEQGADKLIEIHSEIDRKLKDLKFKSDKDFHPHFTIARVKFPTKKDELRRFIRENSGLNLGSFTAEGIELMQSKLSPKGPQYSVIHRIELK